ncbi:asparagine synthase (glutamine-hydrolyzing) [Antrihabitans cavernicola]|uniref:asparagine synthase (glutamine-hydrolyzing) n=1 Tax=Antrihabitans cavernicola TaxID=2495913 RepID=A0A5A7SCZ3_9NOCA|nr:asparagine synthase (glutamine-hydrolyzing) [Spelaeibacter cavernicola]KAA0023052.1 asparagine synthase (glutamine-hydrolyzing) [Spelaeibacter cavernicola]
MCGITGIVDFRSAVDPTRVSVMSSAQRHRGPDGAGTWHDRHVAFGSQRLAIVDVAHGTQPTANEDDTVHVVFNGEIYNHKQLRRALAQRGHTFLSHSDVEVIPHLYEEYGTDFVEKLDGDFAIALWDTQSERLVLTRDRVGVKPLFYHRDGARVVFASEIKAIFASGLCDVAMDPQGLSDCFFYGHPIAPGTFWSGVTELQPGTIVTFDRDGLNQRRYFTPFLRPDPDKPLLSGRAAIELFDHTFTEAVRKRLPDEVQAGVALSGGLDSSAIAAVAAARCNAPLTTASVKLTGEDLDETDMSRLVARSLGVSNVEAEMTGARACELLPLSLWHFESPFWYGAVATPFLDLTRVARDLGLKVAMSGDGSDELLAGYDFYRLMKLSSQLETLRLGRLQPAVWQSATKILGAPSGLDSHIVSVASRLGQYGQQYGEVPPWIYLWSALGDAAKPILREGLPAPSQLPAPPPHDKLRRQLHFEFFTRLPSWVLPISDRLGMAHGIEVRVPYLDRDVIDVCAELAPGMLLHRGTEKYVLKRATADILPKPITRRRKKPFMTPVGAWYLSGPGSDIAHDHLSRASVERYGIFDPALTEKIWRTAVDRTGTWEGTASEWVSLAVMSTHMVLDQFRSLKTGTANDTSERLGNACCSYHRQPSPTGVSA